MLLALGGSDFGHGRGQDNTGIFGLESAEVGTVVIELAALAAVELKIAAPDADEFGWEAALVYVQ